MSKRADRASWTPRAGRAPSEPGGWRVCLLGAAVLGALTVAPALAPASEKAGAPGGPAVERALREIRPEQIEAHMRFLADDLLEGRGTGTRGHRLAALYAATQLEASGLEPAGDGGSYFQALRLARTRPREADCSLVQVASGHDRALAYGTDFVMFVDPIAPDTSLRVPVSFVGYGVSAPAQHYDDYAGIDVTGRIVALLRGAPRAFADAPRAFFADPDVKREAAASHGAVGIVELGTPAETASWGETVAEARRGAMALESADAGAGSARVPYVALLSESGVSALVDGQIVRWQEALADVRAGTPHSLDLAGELSVRQRSERSTLDSANVVAVLRGSDEKLRSEHVVYSAHLDHLGIGEPVAGDAIYNGARDNASGVAGMLAVARAFASLAPRPRRSIVFLATTAEEPGMLGSRYFVRHPPVPLQDIVADINLDGLAVFWPLRDVAGWGARHSSLEAAVRQAAHSLGLEATLPADDDKVLLSFSDQASFARKGVPAVWLVYGDKSWDPGVDPAALEKRWARAHQPDDDMSQPFDFGSSVKLAQAAFLTGYAVACDPRRPSWRAGDFLAEKLASRR